MALEKAVAMRVHGQTGAISGSPEAATNGARRLPESEAPQWFALAVKPRYEKAVARTLERKGFQILLPLYKKRHQYAARTKESELPLFPGYVFCRFKVLTKLAILLTPGVITVLGTGNMPTPLSDTEISSLQTAIQAHLRMQPFPFLQVGQKVRINKGVLAGVEGTILSFKQCLRLVLSITLLQRSVLLEIDRDQVAEEGVLWQTISRVAA